MGTLIVVLFGLAWGSFLNVVIHRLPLRMSLIHPPSTCPECGSRIKPHRNIPVLSYLWLRGCCPDCGARIPVTYLLVEILTPAGFWLLFSQYGFQPHFFAACLFFSAMLVLGFIDYKHQIIPDAVTFPGMGLSLVYAYLRPDMNVGQSLIGAAAGGGFLLLIYGLYYLWRKKAGLGMGDVTMMFFIGAFLGWKLTFFTLMAASIGGAVLGITVMLCRKKDWQYTLPFGSFLAPAAVFALLWGEPLINAYLNLFR
jgi:leader peptidase (prepilin peptidase) / N-methyltransferase